MPEKRGLGRGIESLIPPPVLDGVGDGKGFRLVDIGRITPNRLQPRTVFDEDRLRELADSIREQGVIQPLIVSPTTDGRFELVAGERRLRASKLAGLNEVPVCIKSVDDEQLLAISLLENIQREDLNPIEEASAYEELIEQFGYTQEEVAKRLGKSRVGITNSLRLLKLPKVIRDDVAEGRYSAGHARALLSLSKLHDQLKMREKIMRETSTVRDVESMVQSYAFKNGKQKKKVSLTPQMTDVVEKLKQALGTKVQIMQKGSGGRVTIDYYSARDLDRIYKKIVDKQQSLVDSL